MEAAHFADNAAGQSRAGSHPTFIKAGGQPWRLKIGGGADCGWGRDLLLVIFAGSGSLRRRWIKYPPLETEPGPGTTGAKNFTPKLVDAKLNRGGEPEAPGGT